MKVKVKVKVKTKVMVQVYFLVTLWAKDLRWLRFSKLWLGEDLPLEQEDRECPLALLNLILKYKQPRQV